MGLFPMIYRPMARRSSPVGTGHDWTLSDLHDDLNPTVMDPSFFFSSPQARSPPLRLLFAKRVLNLADYHCNCFLYFAEGLRAGIQISVVVSVRILWSEGPRVACSNTVLHGLAEKTKPTRTASELNGFSPVRFQEDHPNDRAGIACSSLLR
jgi:hypothetical protein